MKDTEQTRAERWKIAAFQLASEKGLAAVTTRALASVTGGSASAITYYFGNRDVLVQEICDRAIAASEAWRAESEMERAHLPGWADLASAFISTLQSRIETGHHLLTLIRELEQDALSAGRQEIRLAIAQEVKEEANYWRDLAQRYGSSAAHSEFWADLALGLTSLLVSERSAARRSAWISLPAYRLQDRLARAAIRFIEDHSAKAADLALAPPANETAARILDAALEQIADKGAEKLNQRDVALKAGISLSSVTYFFGTKQELIAAAFTELCRRHCVLFTDDDLIGREPSEVMAMLSGGNTLWNLATFEALLRATVRSADLHPTADRIRHTRGVGSLVLLRKLGLNVDRLDSFIWISIMTGRYRRIYGSSQADWPKLMRDAAETAIQTIFQASSDT